MKHNILKFEWSILRHPVETQELPNVTFFSLFQSHRAIPSRHRCPTLIPPDLP